MEIPPSYEEAQNPDVWTTLAEKLASNLSPSNLNDLSQVSKHLHAIFNPILWRKPTDIIFRNFTAFHKHLLDCRPSTARLVDVLDFRKMGRRNVQDMFVDRDVETLAQYDFNRYPELKFLVIDGTDILFPERPYRIEESPQTPWAIQPEYDLPHDTLLPKLKNILFSAARCTKVDTKLMLQMPFCHTTLYLDLSYVNLRRFPDLANVQRLPRLRILKLRETRLTNTELEKIGKGMKGSLWSLDVRDNLLTLGCIPIFEQYYDFKDHFRDRSLPGDWMLHERLSADWDSKSTLEVKCPSESAGKAPYINGTMHSNLKADTSDPRHDDRNMHDMRDYYYLSEDLYSWDPDRYLVDSPSYTTGGGDSDPTESQETTENRRKLVNEFRPDTTDKIIDWYYAHPQALTTYPNDQEPEILTKKTGLTQLYLSGNKLGGGKPAIQQNRLHSSLEEYYSPALKLLDRRSHLQLLDCDNLHEASAEMMTNPFYMHHPIEYRINDEQKLYPGYCKALPHNLEVLRIHHSFITQTKAIPSTLRLHGRARIEAEDATCSEVPCICFRPNQNPKLRELTLVDVPRKSLGRVISRLKHLLHTAAEQEFHLTQFKNSAAFASFRSPKLLPGLRVIKLEFRPALGHEREEEGKRTAANRSVTGDVDAEGFADESRNDFSFFNDYEGDGLGGVDEVEVERKRKWEDGEDLWDVLEELRAFRRDTLAGVGRALSWGGEVLVYFGGPESIPFRLTGD